MNRNNWLVAMLLICFTACFMASASLPPSVERAIGTTEQTIEQRVTALEKKQEHTDRWQTWAQGWLNYWGAK